MRTTLKRGIGQVAGNGNGHSDGPPRFGPIVRYRQPDPPKKSIGGRILRGLGWLMLAVVVVGAGAAGGAYLYLDGTLRDVSAHSKPLLSIEKHKGELAQVPPPNHAAIALVAGYDVRGAPKGKNPYFGSNSDTLMLLRADPQNNTLSLLSFPRDLWVNIYCHGDAVANTNRINSAWSSCSNGPAGTLDTVEKLTGLHINYLITLDFHAFTQIVDHLHGIYMNVDRRYYNPPHDGWSAINLEPGYQRLNGAEALSYVRYRHTDSDIYRNGRQQLFLDALKSRVKTSLSIFDVPKLIGDLKHNVEIAQGGGGYVSPEAVKSYVGLLYGLPAGHLFRNAIPLNDFSYPTINGASVVTAPQSAVAAAVHRFLNPNVHDAQAVGSQFGLKPKTPKKQTKQHKLPKAEISVLVLNASGVTAEADNTKYELMTHGYTTKTLPAGDEPNAPRHQSNTTVYYDPVQANAQQAAEQLKPLFGPHTVVKSMTPTISNFAAKAGNPLTVVTTGTSFKGTLTIPKPPKVQPKQPPQVSPGAAMTAGPLRQVYDQVHFPLMVPHLVAQYSVLGGVSDPVSVRAFKPLKNQHEVVLTFQVGQTFKYWQIEESTWKSAPILQSPSFTLIHRGQKYQVYTTSGAVQRVALVTPHAVYWVSNTILNELSNSTMLAIAESLRPLRR